MASKKVIEYGWTWDMSRNHFEIMYNILLLSRGKKTETNLLCAPLWSLNQLQEYFRLLLERNLLSLREVEGHKIYETTEKGIKFLEYFEEIQEYLSKKELLCCSKINR